MTDRKVMSQTSVLKNEIDEIFSLFFLHAGASFDMTEWGKVFFIGSEDANTVFESSEPIKKNFPPLSHVERCACL